MPPKKAQPPPPRPKSLVSYTDPETIRRIVAAAKDRALEVGKPDLAVAMDHVYRKAIRDQRLLHVLSGILAQTSTPDENREFQDEVRASKKYLKKEKKKARAKL